MGNKTWTVTDDAIIVGEKTYKFNEIKTLTNIPAASKYSNGLFILRPIQGKMPSLPYSYDQNEEAAEAYKYIQSKHTIPVVQVTAEDKKKPTLIVSIIIMALLVILFLLIGKINLGGGNKDGYGHDQADAIVIAEKYVKENLKSPSSARFSNEKASLSGSTWTVNGNVEADNSFGTKIKNKFTVTITFTSKNNYTVSGNIN